MDLEQTLRRALDAHVPEVIHADEARPAAVLVPVYDPDEPKLIFTVRTDALPSHKGQISFPGGKIDPGDADATAAALREAHEEIGLDPGIVTTVGELEPVPTFVSGYVVTAVIGVLKEAPQLTRNPAEVASILHVPIAELAEEIRREPGFEHAGRTYPTEAWVWRGHVIWGLTARLLRTLLTLFAGVGLCPSPGPTDSWLWPPDTRAS